MNLSKYEELTGITVPTAQRAAITAQIRRSRAMLESLLGYTLESKKALINQYAEKGKSTVECGWVDGDEPELEDPDAVITAYRLFPYNEADEFFQVDPFTKLNAVKLVRIKSGDEPNGITVKTFDMDILRQSVKNGMSKYIQRCKTCWCDCECTDCVQLAVDADWLFDSCLPDDLLYLWSDIITFEANCKKDIKRETLGSHTYEKFDRSNPLELPGNITLLQKYAGPNGTVNQSLIY